MLEYFFFKLYITSIFSLSHIFASTNEIDEFVQKIKISLTTPNNIVKVEGDDIKDYLPTNEQRVEIWKYIFTNKKQLDVCEHGYDEITDDFFNREFEKKQTK